MVFRMLAVLSELERDLISERTCTALSHKRENGYKTGGTVPFGFDAESDGRLIENPDEQKIIHNILEMRNNGFSLRRIGAVLEKREIVTKTGGTRWFPKTLKSVINRANEA
jgi:DNA invertase Pin-like site-specific DNA recombinase